MKSNKKKSPFSRRQFVKSMSVAAMAAPFTMNFSGLSAKGVSAPSDKINLGIIGCGGLGSANLNACVAHPDVVVTAACDVWKERLDPIVERFKKTCTGYTDYRELLRHKGLDAVIIATPAHWHAIQAIEAAEAGLDIYLQKPMTMHLGESLAVRNAIRKHKNICQVGTQIHSGDHYRRMVAASGGHDHGGGETHPHQGDGDPGHHAAAADGGAGEVIEHRHADGTVESHPAPPAALPATAPDTADDGHDHQH